MKEIEKCVCVCANCHRKIHAGIINLEDYLDKSSPQNPGESVTE
jgi:predicted HNH restriction endonuclease